MGKYRLTEQADAGLIRIHQWGVRNHGEAQADAYFYGLIDQFQSIADDPLLNPGVGELRELRRKNEYLWERLKPLMSAFEQFRMGKQEPLSNYDMS